MSFTALTKGFCPVCGNKNTNHVSVLVHKKLKDIKEEDIPHEASVCKECEHHAENGQVACIEVESIPEGKEAKEKDVTRTGRYVWVPRDDIGIEDPKVLMGFVDSTFITHVIAAKLFSLDPNEYYRNEVEGFSPKIAIEGMGLIPGFIDPVDIIPFEQQAKAAYGFPTFDLDGVVGDDNVYRFKGDEPLHPYGILEREEESILVYPYGIVAFKKNVEGKEMVNVVRMD